MFQKDENNSNKKYLEGSKRGFFEGGSEPPGDSVLQEVRNSCNDDSTNNCRDRSGAPEREEKF